MNIFLDTSTLFKLYHTETGTEDIDKIIRKKEVSKIYLSDITKIEFESVAWKKARIKEINEQKAYGIIKIFRKDYYKFIFIKDDNLVKNIAKDMMTKHGIDGLRTLDAIQLATAVSLKAKVDLNKSSDKLLRKLFEKERLVVK